MAGKYIRPGCLVKARSNNLGIGKVVKILGSGFVTVEYFYSVDKQEQLRLRLDELKTGKVSNNNRCYFKAQDQWQAGIIANAKRVNGTILYEVKMQDSKTISLPESEVYIKCKRDPLGMLAHREHDIGFNHGPRFNFLKSMMVQRSAARGMTGLISAKISLYPHQAEVVRRVLEDPVQRYLLADEVGLGKTIEAGAITRQFLHDNPQGQVLILVPPLLAEQWERELSEKFQLDEFVDRVCLHTTEDYREIRRNQTYGLVVIDEAQHVAGLAYSRWPGDRKLFTDFSTLAHRAERLLLLSATPVLNNEHSFLAMLYLLDPTTYKLEDVARFKDVVLKRQEIGRLLMSFKEGKKPLILKMNLQAMRQLFPGDLLLERLLNSLESKLQTAEVSQARHDRIIRDISVHIIETYRLHSRILRNRRETVEGDVLIGRYQRGGDNNQLICMYDCDRRSEVIQDLLDEWRESALRFAQCNDWLNDEKAGTRMNQMAKIFMILLEGSGTWPGHLQNILTRRLKGTYVNGLEEEIGNETYRLLRMLPMFEGERELLELMLSAVREPGANDDRLKELEMLLDINRNLNLSLYGKPQKCVIFTSFTSTCRQIVKSLISLFGGSAVAKFYKGISEQVIEGEVARFRDTADCFILVCDTSGEEGRNLQFADVLIHFDLPWSPNRIEQRIGRLDRIGRNKALSSYVFAGTQCANSLQEAWYMALDRGFGIFRNSIASLQFYVDEKIPELYDLAFIQGADGIVGTIDAIKEEIGAEKVKIYEQYAMDEIDAIEKYDAGYFSALMGADQNFTGLQGAAEPWLCGVLGLDKVLDDPRGNVLRYRCNDNTLVPGAVLNKLGPHLNRPGTYSRQTAMDQVKLSFFRIGNPFLNAIEKYTKRDDRGRTYIIWRHEAGWKSADWAGFRFDYIIGADLAKARTTLKEQYSGKANLKALKNRAEAFFPPRYITVYVDINLNIENNPDLLEILGRPFRGNSEGGSDYDLDGKWLILLDEVVDLGLWAGLCKDARQTADSFFGYPLFNRSCKSAAERADIDLGVRVARLQMRKSQDVAVEETVAKDIVEGIRHPKASLDSAGFIILSGRDPLKKRRGRLR